MLHALLIVVLLQGPHDSLRAVYRVNPHRDAIILAATALATALPYALADKLITPRCPCDPREVNAFDRGAIGNTSAFARTLSDATLGATLVVPVVIDALNLHTRSPWEADVIVVAQTVAVNGALVTAAKYIVQRPLPRTYAGDPALIDRPGGYRSFYSGHTSLVFAALSAWSMTIRLRYGEKTWPWIATAVLGGSVAIERVADGRHFPSDVIVGAIMGTATGIAVPALHARKRAARAHLTLGPGGGIGVAYRLF
jgi:membrane-associated phospholipid phosphatase